MNRIGLEGCPSKGVADLGEAWESQGSIDCLVYVRVGACFYLSENRKPRSRVNQFHPESDRRSVDLVMVLRPDGFESVSHLQEGDWFGYRLKKDVASLLRGQATDSGPLRGQCISLVDGD